jgi:transposase
VPRKRRKFTAEFKDEAIKLVTERGLSITQAARDLDVGQSTLGRWIEAVRAEAPDEALSWSEREELSRLRRENSRLREEKDILKKAADFFAREGW